MVKIDDLDVEQLVAYEGYEYRISNGRSGLQLNVKTCANCGRNDYKVYLNADTGLGNCFGCDFKYNRYKFVKASRRLTKHGDVMRYLSGISAKVIYKPKISPEAYKLNKDWVLPLNQALTLEEDVPDYLKERNVDAKLCSRFDIRVCSAGFYRYQDFHDRTRFVDFSNRVIIPVKDINGNMVTFQGRDMLGTSEKKYLFPNMLPGTGRYIYNAHYALTNKAKRVVLSEGCFDVWATTKALESDLAYKDYSACGTFGKHLSISTTNTQSSDQLSDLFVLKEAGVEEFIILWDGESSAIKAAIETALRLNAFELNTTVAKLSGGLDPADAGSVAILAAIEARVKPTKFDLMRMRLGSNEESPVTTGAC